MEVYNLRGMITTSPYDNKAKDGVHRAVLRKGHEHEDTAVVCVICFPGVVAYQQGGGSLAKREVGVEGSQSDNAPPDVRQNRKFLATGRGRESLTGEEGFRTKVLCKAVVLLQWGRQMMLTREAGTSVHMDAAKDGGQRYEFDNKGCVDLYDLWMKEAFRSKGRLPPDRPTSPRQSWLPDVSRLFSRSPSLSTGDLTTF